MKNINVKLDPEKDADLIEFLEEKNANTFIIREALKMYIEAYRNMSSPKVLPEAPVVDNTKSAKGFFNK